MPNPSPLHDPMAKLYFPLAPLVPQIRSAAEEQQKNPDAYGYEWSHVLTAAADRIEELEKQLAELEMTDSSSVSTSAGIGFGCALAIAISWSANQSITLAILHGLCSWFYVIYWAIWGTTAA